MLKDILSQKLKPKEKTRQLVEYLQTEPYAVNELQDFWKTARDPDRGALMSAVTGIVAKNPEFVSDFLDFVMEQIVHKAPRVRWESSEIVGYVSKAYPDKVLEAIPSLLENTKYEGTVVRWSAAFALSKIAQNIPETRESLLPKINRVLEYETNNSIRNIYLSALREISKQ
jgi:HEAT repeat protein